MIAEVLVTVALYQPVGMCVPNYELVDKLHLITVSLEEKGWHPKVTEICRSISDQAEKVRLGYSQTMHSKHVIGKAADIVDTRYYWDIPYKHPFWQALGKECKKQGLVWGGDWKGFPDVAHCEMR